MTKEALSQLNPDAFSRFQIVCNEIKEVASSKRIRILDIGGASTYLFDFLNTNGIEFELTIVDIVDYPNKPKEAKLIIQSADNLSFPDNSFDVVTGIDMLEHIPNEKMKRDIINEAIRVGGNLIIFAGPCETSRVTLFEKDLNHTNRLLFGVDQRWLAEHFEYGKPTKQLIRKCYESAKLKTLVFSALPLNEWYLSSVANLMPACSKSVAMKDLNSINTNYNNQFLEQAYRISENSTVQEGYRTFFVGKKVNTTSSKNQEAGDRLAKDNGVSLSRYVDVLVKGLHKTKDYTDQKKHLYWYKSEHKRLQNENQALQQSLQLERQRAVELLGILEHSKKSPIVRGTQKVQKYLGGKDTK